MWSRSSATHRAGSPTRSAAHTASPGDATDAELDSAVIDVVVEAYSGTDKLYAHISGLRIYGADAEITEESPINAPALVA